MAGRCCPDCKAIMIPHCQRITPPNGGTKAPPCGWLRCPTANCGVIMRGADGRRLDAEADSQT